MASTAFSTSCVKPLSRSLQARKSCAAQKKVCSIICSAGKKEENGVNRRNALLAGGLLAGGSLLSTPQPSHAGIPITLKKEKLSSQQINELKGAMITRSEKILSQTISGEDSADALRLLINDAGTYDAVAKTGGVDGSIFFDEELGRPENAPLKPFVEKLKKAKAAIDKASEEVGQEGIGYADLAVLAVKVSTQLAWFEIKKKTTGGDAEAAAVLTKAFGTAFPVSIGRKDATGPSPPGLIPAPDAPAADVIEFFRKLGNKNPDSELGYFDAKPPFFKKAGYVLYTASRKDQEAAENEWVEANPDVYGPLKKSYDKSKRTVTRTVYEVDFVEAFTKLASLGAEQDKLKYLKDLVIEVKT